jgi:multicomponent Na+:H+ antiporter subunit D
VVYLVRSLLNAAYFFPIVYRAFFCRPEDSMFPGPRQEAPLFCVLPPVITAAVSVVLFFYPQLFAGFAQAMVNSL